MYEQQPVVNLFLNTASLYVSSVLVVRSNLSFALRFIFIVTLSRICVSKINVGVFSEEILFFDAPEAKQGATVESCDS